MVSLSGHTEALEPSDSTGFKIYTFQKFPHSFIVIFIHSKVQVKKKYSQYSKDNLTFCFEKHEVTDPMLNYCGTRSETTAKHGMLSIKSSLIS